MSITTRTVRSLGLAFLVGVLWVAVGRTLDAATAVQEGSPAASVGADDAEELCPVPICSPPGRFWLRADYLMWWTSGSRLPPLVTTSPQGTPSGQAGVLPGSAILYGDQTICNDGRSGFRTTLGARLDAGGVWGLEFDYLSLGERADGFSQTSSGDPILARPFFNVQTSQQASRLVAYTGLVEGTISVDAKDYFQSAGALLSYSLWSSDPGKDPGVAACSASLCRAGCVQLLVGFRYCNLSDRLGVVEDLLITQPGPVQNTTFLIQDNFRARNDFYGSEIGLRTRIYRGPWSLEILTKVALGDTHQTVTIDGQTVVTAPNQPTQTYNAGIFALGTNSGTYQRDACTMIPQLGMELGYQVTCQWRGYIGYNVLYWAPVWRAGEQIDLSLDPRNFPPTQPNGLPFPAFPARTSCFWAQGVNVGAEFRF